MIALSWALSAIQMLLLERLTYSVVGALLAFKVHISSVFWRTYINPSIDYTPPLIIFYETVSQLCC
jgi:hypothetical protein